MIWSYLLLGVTQTVIRNGNDQFIRYHGFRCQNNKFLIICYYYLKRFLDKIGIIIMYLITPEKKELIDVSTLLKNIGIGIFFRS